MTPTCDFCGRPFGDEAYTRDWANNQHYHHRCVQDYQQKSELGKLVFHVKKWTRSLREKVGHHAT